jgi:hypothetical protein
MDEADGRDVEDEVARHVECELAVPDDGSHFQSLAFAEVTGGCMRGETSLTLWATARHRQLWLDDASASS